MATYKLIQDVEADDKLLGPLSFKQFLYALVAVFFLYLSWLSYTHHAGFLDVALLPVGLFAGFLAFPFGKDQPTEVWVLAKFRFFVKPRRRIWAQSGIKELVTITAPKKIEMVRTDGLSQTEVKSRLQALANTLDTRGWAVKNVFKNPLAEPDDGTDRLVSMPAASKMVPDDDTAEDDLFDETVNPVAQQVDQLLSANTTEHRQQLMDNLNLVRTNMASGQPAAQPKVASLPDEGDEEIDKKLREARAKSQVPLSNMHAIRKTKPTKVPSDDRATPKPADPVIINLSKRDDLNVSVISHEANRALSKNNRSDEVLISLR